MFIVQIILFIGYYKNLYRSLGSTDAAGAGMARGLGAVYSIVIQAIFTIIMFVIFVVKFF